MAQLDKLLLRFNQINVGGVPVAVPQVTATQNTPTPPTTLNMTNLVAVYNAATNAIDITAPAAGPVVGQNAITLTNGLNSNVATSNQPTIRLTGPSAAFSVGGFSQTSGSPSAGQTLFVVNTTTQPMTLVQEDVSSTAANRITTQSGANVTLFPGRQSSATFVYDGTTSRWVLQNLGMQQQVWRNFADFGAVGDGVTNNDTAIAAALASFPASGGTLYVPQGVYAFQTPISLTAIRNLTIQGDGSRFFQDFAGPVSSMLFTGASSTPALTISGNFARNFKMERMDFAYSNTGFSGAGSSLIFCNLTAGITFEHCSLGGNGAGSGFLTNAESVIKISGSEHVVMDRCILQQATRCVYLPNLGGISTGTIMHECQMGNITRAHVEIAGGSTDGGAIIDRCLIDNTSVLNPTYGILINDNGYNINNTVFAGTNANATPTNSCINATGIGVISGNTFLTNYPAIICNSGSVTTLNGNFSFGNPPLTVLGGMIKGGGNWWVPSQPLGGTGAQNSQPAINVPCLTNVTTFDLGPDAFIAYTGGVFTGNSIVISPTGGSNTCGGEIRYNPVYDQSTLGPTQTFDGHVVLRNMKGQSGYSNLVPRGNSVSGTTQLAVQVIPSNTLDMQGKGLRFWCGGSSPGNNTQVQVAWGGSIVFTSPTITGHQPWMVEGTITRASSVSSEFVFLTGNANGAAITPQRTFSTAALGSDQNLVVFGTGSSANNDVTLEYFNWQMIQ